MLTESKENSGPKPTAPTGQEQNSQSDNLRQKMVKFLTLFSRYNNVIVFVLTVAALLLAIDAMLKLREHTRTLEELREIEYIPKFYDVMNAVTNAMQRYDTGPPLSECYIVTDLIGYGHFSFPDQYRNYETFLSRQKHLQLAVLNAARVRVVLDGQFAFREGLTESEVSSLRVKIDRYLMEYLDRAKSREFFSPLSKENCPCQVLRQRANDSFFGSSPDSMKFVDDKKTLVDCIAIVEDLLYRNFDKNMDGEGLQFDGPSSIHIWWFGEQEAFFALTDETGAEVNGFRSTSPSLNRGLRAIAKKIIQKARGSLSK